MVPLTGEWSLPPPVPGEWPDKANKQLDHSIDSNQRRYQITVYRYFNLYFQTQRSLVRFLSIFCSAKADVPATTAAETPPAWWSVQEKYKCYKFIHFFFFQLHAVYMKKKNSTKHGCLSISGTQNVKALDQPWSQLFFENKAEGNRPSRYRWQVTQISPL